MALQFYSTDFLILNLSPFQYFPTLNVDIFSNLVKNDRCLMQFSPERAVKTQQCAFVWKPYTWLANGCHTSTISFSPGNLSDISTTRCPDLSYHVKLAWEVLCLIMVLKRVKVVVNIANLIYFRES